VVGLACSKDPKSRGYSVATGRISHAGQLKRDDPEENGYPGPPGWGLRMKRATSTLERFHVEETSKMPHIGLINKSNGKLKEVT
jgi:hypothetical protein